MVVASMRRCAILEILGVSLSLCLLSALLFAELRTSHFGLTLSNGSEILVRKPEYNRILQRYRALTNSDDPILWDHAILDALRSHRPRECAFLAQSLQADNSPAISRPSRRFLVRVDA